MRRFLRGFQILIDIAGIVVGLALVYLIISLGIALIGLGCAGRYDTAWRTTAAVREAGTLTDRALASAMRHRLEICKRQPKTLQACIRDSREWAAVREWREWGVPALNSGIIGTVAALQIAERTGAEHIDWIGALKPALCALARVLRQWAALLPAGAQTAISAAIAAAGHLSCEARP